MKIFFNKLDHRNLVLNKLLYKKKTNKLNKVYQIN